MGYRIESTPEYGTWLKKQTKKQIVQIEKRLERAALDEHFGHIRDLKGGLAEFKFNNGVRIYFAIEIREDKWIILLLGGGKNGQSKDIKKAKAILNKRS